MIKIMHIYIEFNLLKKYLNAFICFSFCLQLNLSLKYIFIFCYQLLEKAKKKKQY